MASPQVRARSAKCASPCPYLIVNPFEGQRRGSSHHTFCCGRPDGGRIREEEQLLHLDPETWDGPESTCPLGYWAGLELPAVPDPAVARAQRDVMLYGQAIEILTAGDSDAARQAKLAALAGAGVISPDAADAIKAELAKPEAAKP